MARRMPLVLRGRSVANISNIVESEGMRSAKVVVPEEERSVVASVRKLLEAAAPGSARIAGPDGTEVVLPASVQEGIRAMLAGLDESGAVHLNPADRELTTQEAADLLNVSRPYLVKLLDEGTIPSRMVGTHRRILERDVIHYDVHSGKQKRAALREMVRLSQEMGLD
jgi:excisionase family DNA binding protein